MNMECSLTKFKQLFDKFSKTNSGRVLVYINRSKSFYKLKWILLYLFLLFLTLWSCALNIQSYLKYGTKVSMTYSDQLEIQFPSISFCNQFALSKSAVGSNMFAVSIYTGMFAETMKELISKYDESSKLCGTKSVSESLKDNTSKDYNEMGLVELLKFGARDSYKSVVKSWWNGVEIETDGIFMNHILDAGACFTFMPKKDEAYNYIHSDFSKIIYGVNESAVTDRILTNSGPSHGLRILLNVEQTDHCDTTRKYEGDGFQAVVHDNKLFTPTFSMLPTVFLNPGYEISIGLKPIQFVRKTANLGYCLEPNYFRGTSKYYFKTDCITGCFIKRTINMCHCIPPVIIGLENFFSSRLGFNVSMYVGCGSNHIMCLKQQQFSTFKGENPLITCPECLEPCYETRYNFLVTYNKFPNRNSYDYMKQILNNSQLSSSDMRKNYLMVNFYFDSMTMLTIVEFEAYTIRGLFIFIGCKTGLFLGLSFMSWGEIVQLIIELIVITFHKLIDWKRRKNWRLRLTWKLTTKIKKWKRRAMAKSRPRHSMVSMVSYSKRRNSMRHSISVPQRYPIQNQTQRRVSTRNVKSRNIIFKSLSLLKRWKRITATKVEPASVIFAKNPELMKRRKTIRDSYLNIST